MRSYCDLYDIGEKMKIVEVIFDIQTCYIHSQHCHIFARQEKFSLVTRRAIYTCKRRDTKNFQCQSH